jgi:hypothetical protein
MPEPTPIQFNDHEKLLLNSFCASSKSRFFGFTGFDLIVGLTSLSLMAKAAYTGDMGYGFSAYVLVFGRLCYDAFQVNRWSPHYYSIFSKYDAKIQALEAALAEKQGNKSA